MPGPLQLGRIVWAEIADTNGVRKLRPAIVVTSSDRITPAAPLDVVAVTSRLPEPLPNDHVLLPWHAQGHSRTRLNRRCAAVCTWVARISPDDIREVAGVVPGAIMLDILSKVRAILAAPPVHPGEGEVVGKVNRGESARKVVTGNKPKRLRGLSQKGTGEGYVVSHVRHRGPRTSRPTAGTYPDALTKRNVETLYTSHWERAP